MSVTGSINLLQSNRYMFPQNKQICLKYGLTLAPSHQQMCNVISRVGEPILEESPAVCILKRDDELGAERAGRPAGKLSAGKHCEFCLRKVVRCDSDGKRHKICYTYHTYKVAGVRLYHSCTIA